MADAKEYVLGEMKKYKARADELVNLAEAESRDNTTEETAEIKSVMAQFKEKQIELQRMEDRDGLREQLESLSAVTEIASQEAVPVKARTPGEAFVQSKEYQALIAHAKAEGFPQFNDLVVEMKAAGDATLESDGDNATAIAPTWFGLEETGFVQWRRLVQDVMNIVQIATGNTANYPVVTGRSIESQAATTEGAAKKGATFAFDFVAKTVLKWTAFGGASEEMFEDAPTLVNYINTELGFMALQAEEGAIVTALETAAATNATVNGSGLVPSSAIAYDVVREAMAVIAEDGGTANVILATPLDAAFIDVTRLSGTGYLTGSPYDVPQNGIWGQVRVVETPAATQGFPVIGDFSRGARLFRKGGLRVASSNSHSDYFQKNKVAIRGEVRSITGVTYPEFFRILDIGSS